VTGFRFPRARTVGSEQPDIYELSESIKGPGDRPQPSPNPAQFAAAGRINSAVDRSAGEYGTRDLPFKEVAKPAIQPAAAQKASAGPVVKNELEHGVCVGNAGMPPACRQPP